MIEPRDDDNEDKYQLLSKNYKIINKSFICHLNNVIGSGTFGKVLYATCINQKTEYAIKFEKSSVKSSVIEIEYDIYKQLQSHEGIPKVVWIGEYKKYKLMVMELLGPSLDKYFIACNKSFSTLTAAIMGDQMIRRIHYIHSKGFVHRDVKPNNFMLGKFSKSMDYINEKTLYVIDFGLSKEYVNFETGIHLPFKEGRRFIGTPRYASIGTHLGYTQSRRDDLESIAYIMIYFLLGELPWQGIKAKSKPEKKEKIKDMKLEINFGEYKKIPSQFIKFLQYCRSLAYQEKPNYNFIYSLTSQVMNEACSDGFDLIDYQKHIWQWNQSFMNVNLKDIAAYKIHSENYYKLFDGYPICSFEDYLKKLNALVNSSTIHLTTNSSTTSNTNPNTNNVNFKDEETLIQDSAKEKDEVLQMSKLKIEEDYQELKQNVKPGNLSLAKSKK